MDLQRLRSRIQSKEMLNISQGASGSQYQSGNDNNPSLYAPGLCVASPLSEEDIEDITRCFQRVNRKAEGYLDSEELKEFMDLRRCPITKWEAEKLLEWADGTYHYYINLEQIIKLARNFGIGTPNPLRFTRSEFEFAVRRTFDDNFARGRGRVEEMSNSEQVGEESNFGRAFDFFESRASAYLSRSDWPDPDAESEAEAELLMRPNSRYGDRSWSAHEAILPAVSRKSAATQTELLPLDVINLAYPSKEERTNGEHDSVIVDDEPMEKVAVIKQKWEEKIKTLIETRADDFLLKLEEDKRMGRNPAIPKPRRNARMPLTLNALRSGQKTMPRAQDQSRRKVVAAPEVREMFERRVKEMKPSSGDKNAPIKSIIRTPTTTHEGIQTIIHHGGRSEKSSRAMPMPRKHKKDDERPPRLPPPIVPDLPDELRYSDYDEY